MGIMGTGLLCFIIWGCIQLIFLKPKNEFVKKIPAILVAIFIIFTFIELLRFNNGQSVVWLSNGTTPTPDEMLDTDYLLISVIFGSFLGVALTLLAYGIINKISNKKNKDIASASSVIEDADIPDDIDDTII